LLLLKFIVLFSKQNITSSLSVFIRLLINLQHNPLAATLIMCRKRRLRVGTLIHRSS